MRDFLKKNPYILTVFLILLILGGLFFKSAFIYIPPGQFGIKKVNLGPQKGLKKKVHPTGYHFVLPTDEIHLFPKHFQLLELTNHSTSSIHPLVRFVPAVHVQTSDGFYVTVEASVIYRIEDPYIVASQVGSGSRYINSVVIPKCEPALKQAMGELTTEDFYNSPIRSKAAVKAKKILQKEFQEKGLYVEQVLIRYFEYSQAIQENIEEKKLKDQLVFKNIAEAEAAKEYAKLKKVQEEGEAQIKIILEEGEAYVEKKRAEKELYVRQKRAEADLLVSKAQARRKFLKNEALSEKKAGLRLALSMAEVLEGIELIILPSTGSEALNVLDVNQLVNLWEGESQS